MTADGQQWETALSIEGSIQNGKHHPQSRDKWHLNSESQQGYPGERSLTDKHACTYICPHMCAYTEIYIHDTQAHICTHEYIYIYQYMHKYILKYTHAQIYVYVHIEEQIDIHA